MIFKSTPAHRDLPYPDLLPTLDAARRRGMKVTIASSGAEDSEIAEAGYEKILVSDISALKVLLEEAKSNDVVVVHFLLYPGSNDPAIEWCAASQGIVIIIEYAYFNRYQSFKCIPHLPVGGFAVHCTANDML
jgi:hypothetical protein